MPPESPLVSVVIPTFNRAPFLRAVIKQVLCQSFTRYELIVIDQSDPDSAALNNTFIHHCNDARLHYLFIAARGPSNARNEGLARARGEIVLFIDDDVILLDDHFIAAHYGVYANRAVGGVVGRHVERTLTMNARETACRVSPGGRTIFNLFGTVPVRVGSAKGSNMSFRMEAVAQIGGFDRYLNFLDETDFSTRIIAAGWVLMFEPSAELVHLSAPAGGVREKSVVETETRRFRCTAYYILKNRGTKGIPLFVLTFGLIAL
ncbi:MAG: glycosyltransferase family 2 protein, partial [Acidocella sp.]|nr:glycosyltransferase family 2 protein [Acidocella sp.]